MQRSQPTMRKINQYDLNNNFIKSFISIADAARELHINRIYLVRHLSGKTKRCRQWIFKYANE